MWKEVLKLVWMTDEIDPWTFKLDSREPPEVKELTDLLCEYKYEVATLPSADMALFYSDIPVIGVERKSSKDFIDSIRDGRVFRQADMMKGFYQVSFIAVSGSIGDYLYDTEIPMSVIMGTIASLVTRRNINILWFDYDDQLVDCILYMFKKITEGKYDDVKVGREAEFISYPIYTLVKIPFVSSVMANDLLEKFGSIDDIAKAEKDELMEIKGIGEKRYKELKEVLNDVDG